AFSIASSGWWGRGTAGHYDVAARAVADGRRDELRLSVSLPVGGGVDPHYRDDGDAADWRHQTVSVFRLVGRRRYYAYDLSPFVRDVYGRFFDAVLFDDLGESDGNGSGHAGQRVVLSRGGGYGECDSK